MAEKNAPVNTPVAKQGAEEAKAQNASAAAVMAARLKRVQDMGIFNPQMQRGFDRMTAGIEKGGK